MLLKNIKLLIIFISFVIFSFFSSQDSLAAENSFVNIVNPVRGNDFWSLSKQEPLDVVKQQLKIIKENNFSATWLLRPDVIFNQNLSSFFKDLGSDQELGIFLEVTPTWTSQAKIKYHQEPLWHYANSVFLSGYQLAERKILIDTAFEKFKEIYNFYPKSVGAWHIDADSLSYMQKRYGVKGALICADQFLTDDYQIWGGWWGVPYYPSRFNVLIPAQSEKNKLPLVIFQWAARDPVNGYGSGVWESTFSVQANDYLQHHLTTDYFSKLIDVYLQPSLGKFGQITIGLENDNPWSIVGKEYENQIKVLVAKKIKTVTMSAFATWYQKEMPGLSPQYQISSEDLLGLGKKATWLMSTNGRLGILEENGQKTIRDWRIYNEKWAEPYLEVANQSHQLKISLPAKIDTVRFPDQIKPLNENQENLLQQKIDLPFQTSKVVFLLMGIIFLTILIISFKLNRWVGLLMLLGVMTQVLTMVKSGLLYSFGMGFWGPNGHDGIWHLALINELTRNFPPQNPVFAQFKLLNYHWLFDLLVALINKITLIPTLNLYFQIFPIIFSGLLGILTFLLVKKITKNNLTACLAVFFAYFGGSFGWLVTLFRHQGIGGESMFWANQSISFLINPPFALSLLLILFGFYLFLDYQRKPTKKLLIILSLVLGLVIGVKAYGGIIVLFGLMLAFLWEWLKKRQFTMGRLFLSTLAVSLIIFLPVNWKSPSLFVFSPLWFSHTMLAFPDRLGWIRLDQARQVYLASGKLFKWILAEGLALVIFFVGNLGTRILGIGKIFSWFKNFKKLEPFQIFFLSCLVISAVVPLLFVQKGNPWNSIQFFYYFLFLFGFLGAWFLGEFLTRKKVWMRILLISSVVFLTIPTSIGTLKHYLPARAPARISLEELEALDFLKDQPEGIVLTYPHDYQLRERFEAPKPLYAYETTAYVSAFSNKSTFLEDEMNLDIMGVKWRPRRDLEEQFFTTHNEEWARNFLKENNIKYVYLVDDQKFEGGDFQVGLVKIFENGEVRIFEFRDKI